LSMLKRGRLHCRRRDRQSTLCMSSGETRRKLRKQQKVLEGTLERKIVSLAGCWKKRRTTARKERRGRTLGGTSDFGRNTARKKNVGRLIKEGWLKWNRNEAHWRVHETLAGGATRGDVKGLTGQVDVTQLLHLESDRKRELGPRRGEKDPRRSLFRQGAVSSKEGEESF